MALSFASRIKQELAQVEVERPCCARAQLDAILRSAGTIGRNGQGAWVQFSTDNLVVAQHVFALLQRVYGVEPELARHERRRLGRLFRYSVDVRGDRQAHTVLTGAGLLGDSRPRLGACCKIAYLRGLYLGCGAMSDPRRAYQLEFVLEHKPLAQQVQRMLASRDMRARMVRRGEQFVVYIKEAEPISTFLALTGAHSGVLALENIRIYKDIRNHANRSANCDAANCDKTARAAARQLADIRLIMTQGRFDSLPQPLKEVAAARLEAPEANLAQIAGALQGISKSGVNHRFARIEQIANQLRQERGVCP